MSTFQTIVSGPGPLPLTVKFTPKGDGHVMFYCTGSAYSTVVGNMLQVQFLLDSTVIGTASVYTNESYSHKALVPIFVPAKLTDPGHTITVQIESANTITDFNDNFQVVLIY